MGHVGRRERVARAGRKTRTRAWFAGGALALLALGVVVSLLLRPAAIAPLAVTDDPVLGRADAPVTVFYFADYQCPYCRVFETGGGMDAFKRDHIDTGDVRLAFKDMPFIGADSRTAAEASMFVWHTAPSIFWDWHHRLFLAQGPEGSGWASESNLLAFSANFSQLNVSAMRLAIDAQASRAGIDADIAAARAHGVSGTPTLVIGGRVVSAIDKPAVDAAVASALGAAGGASRAPSP